MNISIILKCEKIIRDLANEIAFKVNDKPFKLEIKKKLKFENDDDWNVLCSLMDVLSDTELAKKNFIKYGLGGPTKITDYGEQYLRLYGITNACFLQKSAILAFIEIIKLPNKKIETDNINSSRLIEFRNIIGAHTIDYLDAGVRNPHQFQRASIERGVITTSDSNNRFKEYNLRELMEEFNELIENILIKSTEKFIKTVYKNGGNKKNNLLKKIEALKLNQDGGIVIWPDHFEEPLIVKIKR